MNEAAAVARREQYESSTESLTAEQPTRLSPLESSNVLSIPGQLYFLFFLARGPDSPSGVTGIRG